MVIINNNYLVLFILREKVEKHTQYILHDIFIYKYNKYMTLTRNSIEQSEERSSNDINSIKVNQLNKYKRKFNESETNKLIQNSLCSNSLYAVSEVREYMQSRDHEFSHTLDPELKTSDQGFSGSCWLFAVLNVMRHELIRDQHLVHDFELSETYLCFYEKMEKCNYFLTQFIDMDKIDLSDHTVRELLHYGCEDGGLWITCSNLIKKYGVIPKTSFRESVNSFSTNTMNDVLNSRLKEFALTLTKINNKNKKIKKKEEMMNEIYDMLCKMLGTPPRPDEKISWSFSLNVDLTEKLEREQKRQKNGGEYENVTMKNVVDITPLEFYENIIVHKLQDYIKLGNDPRKKYNKYFISPESDVVIEGEKNYFFNVSMDTIEKMCVNSIVDNTPVQFDCDVDKYLNYSEDLFDDKCFDFKLVFGNNIHNLSKESMLNTLSSRPNHTMVLVGVDLDENNKPVKWKIENSWGCNENSNGHYVMSNDWFKRFGYNVILHEQYIDTKILKKYKSEKKNLTVLSEFDPMG
jgi:bleomycin hydrolase